MALEYKVVAFIGKLQSGESPTKVSAQLQAAIARETVGGWELDRVADVNIEVAPGCIAGLFGAKVAYVKFDQLIFRKPASSVPKPPTP